jgi:hypothetical protein
MNTSADHNPATRGSHANKTGMNRTVPSLGDLENYVYESGGAGVYIYHVEVVSPSRAHMKVKTPDSVYIGH